MRRLITICSPWRISKDQKLVQLWINVSANPLHCQRINIFKCLDNSTHFKSFSFVVLILNGSNKGNSDCGRRLKRYLLTSFEIRFRLRMQTVEFYLNLFNSFEFRIQFAFNKVTRIAGELLKQLDYLS